MDEIYATVTALLPIRRKTTPSGWISFDAVCCHHRGESRDDRSRGGILPNQNGGFRYHCFNCGYKAGWTPGHVLSINTRQLLRWIGVSDSDIMRMALTALKLRQDQDPIKKTLNFELVGKPLPEECKLITEWAKENCTDADFLAVLDYLDQRGMELDWYDWMWSSAKGYRDRVILPFYYDRKIVGYTGRKIRDGKPKYLTESQPGYVFNLDHQTYDRKYVIVVEGQFDAISIDGVAIMHNEPNETQCARINALGKEVIVVPDRDHAGSKIIKSATDHNWSVSMPEWSRGIKDVADAVKEYGRLYTLFTILHYKESNEIKIQLLKKKLENIDG
jgi:5S rRNA maturation endonuclease (ribonuclease M5)